MERRRRLGVWFLLAAAAATLLIMARRALAAPAQPTEEVSVTAIESETQQATIDAAAKW